MSLQYQTSEEIRKGDRILFYREPGVIEFLAYPDDPDPKLA
jgi:hypothetical protein